MISGEGLSIQAYSVLNDSRATLQNQIKDLVIL